tara:strand:- start:337 stop:1215 length:879 start_codon:yes stop_codon:yes gene_type:complete
MNILVTGGAGFIGTNLIKKLLKDDNNVVCSIDNYECSDRKNEQDGCIYYNFDLCDESFFIHKKFDIVFHLAAQARIQPSIKNPTRTLKNNFLSTLSILENSRKNDIPVIYSGSSSFHKGIFKSPYAWSKFCGEQLCMLYTSIYGLKTMIARFYNVYGPYQIESGEWSTVLGRFEKQYRDKKPLTIVGDGKQIRDFTHVNDIVDALIKMKNLMIKTIEENNPLQSPVFELGRGKNHSINEVADMFGKEYPKKYINKRPGEYDYTLADNKKAKKILDWNPKLNLKDYIKQKIGS